MSEVSAELVLLRAFYVAWTEMHSIPRDVLNRRKQERAAQTLVERADVLRNFYVANTPPERPKLALVPTDGVDAIAADFDKATEHG